MHFVRYECHIDDLKLWCMLLWISKCVFFYFEPFKTIHVAGKDETNNKLHIQYLKGYFIAVNLNQFKANNYIELLYRSNEKKIKLQNKLHVT